MNIRDNKGITLMAEVMTILLMILIVSIITYSSLSTIQVRNLNNMYSDIVNIQEKAQIYYLKNGEAPVNDETVSEEIINSIDDEKNPNDEIGQYYKVDFSLLDNISLNNKQTENNYYFMNKKTLTVYFSKGVEVDDENDTKVYHTLPSNYKGIGGAEKTALNVSKYQ